MSITDGELANQIRMRRLQESIPTDYTIWKDGSTYRAESNIAGGTDYSGTNVATVLQSVITTLKTVGGKISIKSPINLTGRLDLSNITKGLIMEGISDDEHAVTIAQNNDVVFDLTGSAGIKFVNMYFLVPTEYAPSNIFLLARKSTAASAGNHTFDGCIFNSYTSTADKWFYIYGSELNLFLNCAFYAKNTMCCITAKNIDTVTSPYQTIATGEQSMQQIYFTNNTVFSMPLSGAVPYVEIEGAKNVIFSNIYAGSGNNSLYFLKFRYHATPLSIEAVCVRDSLIEQRIVTSETPPALVNLLNFKIDNLIDSPDASSNIVDLNKANLRVDGHSINDLKMGTAGNTLNYNNLRYSHINLLRGYDGTEPTINVADLTSSEIEVLDYAHVSVSAKNGLCTIIARKTGSVTENSGSSTGTGAEQTIAHSLVATPTMISVTPTVTGATVSGVWANATNIYCTVTSGKAFNWSAKVI